MALLAAACCVVVAVVLASDGDLRKAGLFALAALLFCVWAWVDKLRVGRWTSLNPDRDKAREDEDKRL